jgi:hypothetical protein
VDFMNLGFRVQFTDFFKATVLIRGSMLWWQFSEIFDNFRRKNCRFSQKPI